jgi:hypothetical protein
MNESVPTREPLPPREETAPNAAPPGSLFDFSRGPNRRQSRRFFNTVLFLGAVAVGYFGLTSKIEDPFLLYQGLLILALSWLPAILWARFLGQQFPTFETFLFTFSNSFAIPLLTGHRQLAAYTDDVISMAAWGVITFQVAAIGTFYATSALPKRTPFWREEIFSDQIGRYLGYAMVLNTAFVVLSTYFAAIPRDLIGPLRAVFFGIGIICTFVQSLRWGQGSLRPTEKTYFVVNLAVQILVLTGTLFLVNGVSLLILALAGYVCGSRRLPVLICVVALLVLGILHNGKFVMRAKYWEGADSPTARNDKLLDLPAFYVEWFTAGLQVREENEEISNSKHKLLERTSLFHMMCLVISLSPEKLPYLGGDTYRDIPGQFVPRFFWPDKPLGHVSTYRLSVYYGLQREEDTVKTTIGFGILPEAYANFGFFGLALVGALVGFCQKIIRSWSAQSPILSYPGILTVLLMSWSFSTEHTMSIWLSSLYQACVAVLGLIVIVRSFVK